MFNTDLPLYGFCVMGALIANLIVVIILSKKYNYKKFETFCLVTLENFGIIFGAKYYAYLCDQAPLGYKFSFVRAGMSAYGGLFGAIVCIIIFKFIFRKKFKELLYIFMPSISIMYAISKIGCFLIGCCYGIEYHGIGNVVYNYSFIHKEVRHLFPVQLAESIAFFGIFIYNMVIHKKNKYEMKAVAINFILCGGAKFILEYLRQSHVGVIISSTQVVSIIFIMIGIIIYVLDNKKN